jgi:hypothetical protein
MKQPEKTDLAMLIMAHSKLELDNPAFENALMDRIMRIEKRRKLVERNIPYAMLALGAVVLSFSFAYYLGHTGAGVITRAGHLSGTLFHSIGQTGRWVLIYARYVEMAGILLMLRLITDSQSEIA